MKNALLIIFLFTVSLSVTAQSASIDKRLLAKYSKSELKTLQKENPTEYKYLNDCLDNAWSIVALPKEKMKNNNGRIGSIKIKNIKRDMSFVLFVFQALIA